MRIWRIVVLLAAALTATHQAAHAQYTGDQPRSLRGLKTVTVVFAEPTGKIEERTREQLYQQATLELRKAGLRIAPAHGQTSPDGVLNIGFFVRTGLSDAVGFRMDVEQMVRMQRTREDLNLVTWYYESEGNAPSWRSDVGPMLQQGMNKFLSDWLEANGR